jgi:hypothetical protein
MPLCPLHHKLLDKGRISRAEVERIREAGYPDQFDTAEELIEWAGTRGYRYTVENLERKFWNYDATGVGLSECEKDRLKRSYGDWLRDFQEVKGELLPGFRAKVGEVRIMLFEDRGIACNLQGTWIVVHDAIGYFDRAAMRGILAHEAAHIYLKLHPNEQREGEDGHLAADRIAREWGFGEGLAAFLDRHDRIRLRLGWSKLSEERLEAHRRYMGSQRTRP